MTLGGVHRLTADTEFRLIPRGTEPLEPTPGVRFESPFPRFGTRDENPVRLTFEGADGWDVPSLECVPAG